MKCRALAPLETRHGRPKPLPCPGAVDAAATLAGGRRGVRARRGRVLVAAGLARSARPLSGHPPGRSVRGPASLPRRRLALVGADAGVMAGTARATRRLPPQPTGC